MVVIEIFRVFQHTYKVVSKCTLLHVKYLRKM